MGVTYKVIAPVAVDGHAPGTSFVVDAEHPSSLNTAALVAGGLLKVAAAAKETCPSCVERNVKGAKTRQYTAAQLADHYRKDHPGLQPPAGEEE